MKKEIIGVVGYYSHDVILMLAKVLSGIGKSVLLLDRNIHHTLEASLPVPQGVKIREQVMEYEGFFFSEAGVSDDMLSEYDVIFIDFGMSQIHNDLQYCSQFYIITDMLLHHMQQVGRVNLDNSLVKRVLIRDAVYGKVSEAGEIKKFLNQYPNCSEFYVSCNKQDVRNRWVCESLHEYSVKKASSQLRDFIFDTARELCGEIAEKEFYKKLKRQERRGEV